MGYHLGVDIGSVNAELVLIDENGRAFNSIPSKQLPAPGRPSIRLSPDWIRRSISKRLSGSVYLTQVGAVQRPFSVLQVRGGCPSNRPTGRGATRRAFRQPAPEMPAAPPQETGYESLEV